MMASMIESSIADLAPADGPLATAFDRAVLASVDIDRFCSSTHWIVPARHAFHATHEVFVRPLGDGYCALTRGETAGLGRFYAPLEAMWGLACPIVGAPAETLGRQAAEVLLAERARWDVLWLGGVRRDGPLWRGLVRGLSGACDLRLGPTTTRHQASLEGGFDGWLSRRSAKFRKMLRQAMRDVRAADVELEWVDGESARALGGEALFARIHAIERRSWKGMEGTGFVQGDMRTFYERMLPRLASAGRLRVLFGRQGGEDVAFCFGGVLEGTFRGLQNSYDDRLRALSLGNAMQAHTIEHLAREGVTQYDLGSEMEYKARFAEGGLVTATLIAVRR